MSAAKKISKFEGEAFQHAPTTTTNMPAPRTDTSARAMLAQLATSPNFNAEAFRMIVDMVREEQAASAKAAFAAAFPDAQKELPIIKRGGKGHNGKTYAQLEDILAEVLPILNRHGFQLFHTQEQPTPDVIKVRAVLRHREGYEETNELVLPLDTTGNKNPVQARGSTVSYGRRYTILSLLGLATEDDDGQAAGGDTLIDAEQLKTIEAAIEFAGANKEKFKKYFKITAIEKLPAKRFDDAMAMLEEKAAKQ